jgi:hypothetical protein
MTLSYAQGRYANTLVDHNLYYNNGWLPEDQGGMWHAGVMVVREDNSWDPYPTLAELQAATPWEDHGQSGSPAFWDYNLDDHALHDGSWPDFHLTPASTFAIDQGTAALPASLLALLDLFDVADFHWGPAYDLGRYEAGFALLVAPPSQAIDPGGTARYTLSLSPPDLPFSVALAEPSLPSGLTGHLSQASLTGTETATLAITDTHTTAPGIWYSIEVSGSGGGFSSSANVGLLVGGDKLYLPVLNKLR